MNKNLVQELKKESEKVADNFSKKREGNFNNELFKVEEIIPMTDHTAAVIFKKNTGKSAVAFFYYINMGMSKGWKYFFPTDAHILGMQNFGYYKLELERKNYRFNFDD